MNPDLLREHAILVEKATRNLEKAVEKNDFKKVQEAMDQGALLAWARFPNKSGTYTNTVIQKTINHGNVKMLDYFLRKGATTVTREKDPSLYERALQQKNQVMEIIRLLSDHGILMTEKDQLSILRHGAEGFDFLHEKKLLNADTKLGFSEKQPLLFWCLDGDVLDRMISLGCDINQKVGPLGKKEDYMLKWVLPQLVQHKVSVEQADQFIERWIDRDGIISLTAIETSLSFLPPRILGRMFAACSEYQLQENDLLEKPYPKEGNKNLSVWVTFQLQYLEKITETLSYQNKFLMEKNTPESQAKKPKTRF